MLIIIYTVRFATASNFGKQGEKLPLDKKKTLSPKLSLRIRNAFAYISTRTFRSLVYGSTILYFIAFLGVGGVWVAVESFFCRRKVSRSPVK